MRSLTLTIGLALLLACSFAAATGALRASSADANAAEPATIERRVAGSGVHYMSTVIVHSVEGTETGLIQRSTETIDLTGDLTGRILYQPTTVVDFKNGTLTNTGHQVFSGTVLGSAPVLLHDDEFRFDVNLATGAGSGKVYLTDNIAGPKIRCELDIVVTGRTAENNVTADYQGFCRFRGE